MMASLRSSSSFSSHNAGWLLHLLKPKSRRTAELDDTIMKTIQWHLFWPKNYFGVLGRFWVGAAKTPCEHLQIITIFDNIDNGI